MTTRQQRWQINNPLKDKAHRIVKSCVKSGLIKKPDNCEECGENVFLTSHHSNYKKPYDVEWLCRPCHKNRHRKFPNRRAPYKGTVPKNLMRLKEVAAIFDVKKGTIRYWVISGRLKAVKFGPRLLVIEKSHLEKYIKDLIKEHLYILKRLREE